MSLQPFIVGNWKMNGVRAMLAEARAIDRAAARAQGVEVGLAPPFTLIHDMAEAVNDLMVGGQDCHARASGAFTGDVSAAMLADAGARFVIVGHSERRAGAQADAFGHGESDSLVRAKAEAALATDLSVILCVGEGEAERNAGRAEAVVCEQLLASLPQAEGAAARLTIAYEPVWAIGTGRVPTTEEIGAMHGAIRARLIQAYGDDGQAVRILYGGSVNAENAVAILAIAGVDGALVGGASLTVESFATIILAAAQLRES